MSKIIIPLAICCAVVFSSCQPAAPAGGAQDASSSSSASATADAMQPADPWKMIADWSGDVRWGDAVQTTNPDAIMIDDAHTIEAGKLQAAVKVADLNAKQYGEYFADKRSDLDAAMAAAGWQRLNGLDADGPAGTQWGYLKSDEHGMTFVSLSAHCETNLGTADKEQDPGACTDYQASAMVTATLAAGDDM